MRALRFLGGLLGLGALLALVLGGVAMISKRGGDGPLEQTVARVMENDTVAEIQTEMEAGTGKLKLVWNQWRHGPDDARTLLSMESLISPLRRSGDSAAAEILSRNLLSSKERTLGPDHWQTLNASNDLGWLLHAKGENAAAEPYVRRALEGRKRDLGDSHHQTANAVYLLSRVLERLNRLEEAVVLAEEALTTFKLYPWHSPSYIKMHEDRIRKLKEKLSASEAGHLAR
jgi:tetratricopeptide (TPR) repeat protein